MQSCWCPESSSVQPPGPLGRKGGKIDDQVGEEVDNGGVQGPLQSHHQLGEEVDNGGVQGSLQSHHQVGEEVDNGGVQGPLQSHHQVWEEVDNGGVQGPLQPHHHKANLEGDKVRFGNKLIYFVIPALSCPSLKHTVRV